MIAVGVDLELSLNAPERIVELRQLLRRKNFLRRFYAEIYSKFRDVLTRANKDGLVVELGAGASFVKEFVPETITSDIIPYEGIDRVVDATRMPFADNSVRAIFLMNVFHHIPDPEAFLREADRCLVPGGRIYIFDQTVGWLSRFIMRYLHHEPFNPKARNWAFESSGPLSDANTALAWIVFQRDLIRFQNSFPRLKLVRYLPHSPLRYWLAGGLKSWTLLPGFAFSIVTVCERVLASLLPGSCCFVDIELVKCSELFEQKK